MEFVIYVIINNVNQKKYIGRSQEFPKRKRSHINMLRKNSHNNFFLQEDWNHFGEESFTFEVVESYTNEIQSHERELELINSIESSELYNIVKDSSVGGNTFTHNPRKEITRKKRSENAKGEKNPMYGKPKSEKMLQRVKEVNSKSIIIEGVEYQSLTQASKLLGLGVTTVAYRLNSNSKKFAEWNYK